MSDARAANGEPAAGPGSGASVFVGSIDQGTTSTRFLIFNTAGEPVAGHQIGFDNKHPQSGWHEQDPLELLRSVEMCIEKATAEFCYKGFSTADVRAVGVTNERETLVLWDKTTGEPLQSRRLA